MFDNLTFVIAISGAIGASFVGYIMPSLLYLKVFEPEIVHAFKGSILSGFHWAALPVTCLLFGLTALVMGTYHALDTLIT